MAARVIAAGTLSILVPLAPGDAVPATLAASLVAITADVVIVHADADGGTDSAGVPAVDANAMPVKDTRDCHGCRVIHAARGRAHQQNAGAAATGSRWLWFVHADSALHAGTAAALRQFIAHDDDAIGYCDLRFLDDGPALMPVNAAGAWLRSRVLGLPFGDQGLLVRRDTFDRLGGFDAGVGRGEDHAFVWRARRAGVALRPLRVPLSTSARRYAEHGWWATTADHLRETWRQARRFAPTDAAR